VTQALLLMVSQNSAQSSQKNVRIIPQTRQAIVHHIQVPLHNNC